MGTLSGQKFDQTKYNQVKFSMIKNVKDLIKRYGPDAEKVIHGRALKTALNSTEMKENRIREIIHQALSEKKEFPDLTGDGKVTRADILKGRGVDVKEGYYGNTNVESYISAIGYNSFEEFFSDNPGGEEALMSWIESIPEFKTQLMDSGMFNENIKKSLGEDLDLGHTDDEPHMLKADLYKIGKYAMELYQMVDKFEGQGEVDFPHWWQAKIIKAASMMSSAKHYLEFELKEPQVDAMVGVASSEDVIDEKLTAKTPMKKYIKDFAKSDAPQFKGKSKEKKRQMAVAAKLSAENPTNAPMMEGEIDKADILSGELYKLKGKIQDAFFDKIRKFINMGSYEDAEYLLNRVKGQMKEKAVAAKLSAENPTEGLAEIILNKLKNR